MLSSVKRLLSPWFYKFVAKASRRYVAGLNFSDATKTGRVIQDKGYLTSFAYWNADTDTPEEVAAEYQHEIDWLAEESRTGYLSIKAPAFQFDGNLCHDLLLYANQKGIAIHFDSLSHEDAEKTFALIKNECSTNAVGTGCSLPGRWNRSIEDAQFAIDHNIIVRVVKGQWPDPVAPDLDPAAGFLDIVRKLSGKAPLVRIATHDPGLARDSIEILHSSGTACELELLYGLPVTRILPLIAETGVRVRMYIPYGHAWVPYSIDQLRRKPRMLGWLIRDAISGSSPVNLPAIGLADKY